MGAFESKTSEEILEVFEENNSAFENWGTQQVTDLHKLYIAQNCDFGLSPEVFEQLVADSVPTGRVASHRLLKLFDSEASGMVDALEILTSVSVASTTTSIGEKISQIFSFFDFDDTKTMTYDELFIMIFSTLRAMQKILGKGHEPEDSDCERIVVEIFLKAGKEPPAALISVNEVSEWIIQELNLGKEKGKTKSYTLGNLCFKFGILDEDDAREIEEARLLMEASQPRKKKHHHHQKH